MTRTVWVTAWVGEGGDVVRMRDQEHLLVPADCEAIHAWGEALILEAARRRNPDHELAQGIRTRCVLASPPNSTPELGAPTGNARLRVLEDKCGVGRESALDPVFAWPSWNELKAYLCGLGFDEAFVDESVSPTSFDEAFMQVNPDLARDYILKYLDPRFLEVILKYFADSLEGYLRSWTSLRNVPASVQHEPGWRVVVPERAVVEVSK